MPTYQNNISIASTTTDGLLFFPSGSAFNVTSSAPATATEVEIIVPPNLGGTLISDTVANPFIRIPVISSSVTNEDNDDDEKK